MESTYVELVDVLNYVGILVLACVLPTQLVFVWFHWRRRDRHPIAGRYPRLVFIQNMVIVPMTALWGSALVGGVGLPCFLLYGANAIGICLVLLLHTIRTVVLLFQIERRSEIYARPATIDQGSTLSRWEQSWFTRHRRLIQPRVLNRIALTGAACSVIVFGLLAAMLGDVPHQCSSSTSTYEITNAWIVLAYAFCQVALLILLYQRLRHHGHDAFGTMKEYRVLAVTLGLWLLVAMAGTVTLSRKYIAWWFTGVLVFAFGTFLGVTTCWPVIISMLYERKQVASLENLSQLSELLAIPKGFTVFLKFAITEFSSEYVLFWKCAEDLRTGMVQTASVDPGEEQRKVALARRRSEDASNNPLVAQLPPLPSAATAGAQSASSTCSGDKNDAAQMNANGGNGAGYSRTTSLIDPPFRSPVLRRNATANECLAEARRIYDTYVRIGSPFEVSLGIEHRVLIEQRLRELQAALHEHDEYRRVMALSAGVDLSRRYETPQRERVLRPADDVKINLQSPSGVTPPSAPGDLSSPSTQYPAQHPSSLLSAATVTSSPMHSGTVGISSPTVMWATARPGSSPGLQLQAQTQAQAQPAEIMGLEAEAEHGSGSHRTHQPHGLGRPGKSFSATRLAHNGLSSMGPMGSQSALAITAPAAGAGTGAAPGSPSLQPQSQPQTDRKAMRERRKHEKRELEKQVLLLKEPTAPPPALRAEEQLLDEIKHLFDEAQSEVVLALQGGTFPRFKASEIYQSFLREYKGWIPTGDAIRLRPLAAALPPRPAAALAGNTHAHAAQPAGNNIELLHPGHRPDFASSMMSGHFTQTSALMASMNPLSMSHDVSLGIGSFGSGGGGGFGGRFGSMRRLDAPAQDMLPNSVAD